MGNNKPDYYSYKVILLVNETEWKKTVIPRIPRDKIIRIPYIMIVNIPIIIPVRNKIYHVMYHTHKKIVGLFSLSSW